MKSIIALFICSARARHIRELYKQLEERLHGSAWTPQELFIGFGYDVGDLGRLVMATQDRWVHKGDLPEELAGKLSECLWWILVLAERLDVDITQAFAAKMASVQSSFSCSFLSPSISGAGGP